MKTKEIKKEQSILADLRLIRDKISTELSGKTPEQIVEFLKLKKTLHPTAVWQNGRFGAK